MNRIILSIPIMVGILGIGLIGVFQFSSAEIEPSFTCTPNTQNGHVFCSDSPKTGERGLFVFGPEANCPMDVNFIIKDRMVVEIQDGPNCEYQDGFVLVLTIDEKID